DSVNLQGYEFVFKGISQLQGPNYSADVAHVDVYQNSQLVSTLKAEKRFYPVQRNVMTEAGIDSGFSRDLFVALGEQLKNGDWSLRIYVKPFINWIWAGAFIMAIGGVFSISDKRYRMGNLARNAGSAKENPKNLMEQTS
ncbi:MAG: cytochrome c-type biogenesis CcmF C-terminal domain-containing protein, partial [Paraglaciecola sp.]